MTRRITGGYGDGRRAESLRAAMSSETAREQSVAVGNVDEIIFGASGCGKRACNAFVPHFNVVLCVANDDLLTGRAAGSVQTDNVGQGNCKHSVRIGVSQILFHCKRELFEIVNGFDVVGRNTGGIHSLAIDLHVVVYVTNDLDQSLGLKRFHFGKRHCFNGRRVVAHLGNPRNLKIQSARRFCQAQMPSN